MSDTSAVRRRRPEVEQPAPSVPIRRIVVVDDDVVVGMTLTLGRSDTEVVDLNRLAGALRRIRDARPDAVVVDRRLSDGDGLDLVREIRNDDALRGLPVVVVTAGFYGTDVDEVIEAGADHYVPKPFEPDELMAIIEAAIVTTTGTGSEDDARGAEAPDVIDLRDVDAGVERARRRWWRRSRSADPAGRGGP